MTDCLAGTLGFVNILVRLLKKARPDELVVDGDIPYKDILQLLLQFLICCCGAVGIQAFNYLRVPTARLLVILKSFTYIYEIVYMIVLAMMKDSQADKTSGGTGEGKLDSYRVAVMLWSILVAVYLLYIVWSFYKRLEENEPVGDIPQLTFGRSLPQPAYPVAPGYLAEPQGHCPECFQVPGSNALECSCCANCQRDAHRDESIRGDAIAMTPIDHMQWDNQHGSSLGPSQVQGQPMGALMPMRVMRPMPPELAASEARLSMLAADTSDRPVDRTMMGRPMDPMGRPRDASMMRPGGLESPHSPTPYEEAQLWTQALEQHNMMHRDLGPPPSVSFPGTRTSVYDVLRPTPRGSCLNEPNDPNESNRTIIVD